MDRERPGMLLQNILKCTGQNPQTLKNKDYRVPNVNSAEVEISCCGLKATTKAYRYQNHLCVDYWAPPLPTKSRSRGRGRETGLQHLPGDSLFCFLFVCFSPRDS